MAGNQGNSISRHGGRNPELRAPSFKQAWSRESQLSSGDIIPSARQHHQLGTECLNA